MIQDSSLPFHLCLSHFVQDANDDILLRWILQKLRNEKPFEFILTVAPLLKQHKPDFYSELVSAFDDRLRIPTNQSKRSAVRLSTIIPANRAASEVLELNETTKGKK